MKSKDEEIRYYKIFPVDGFGRYFNDQKPLRFDEYGISRAPSCNFPEYGEVSKKGNSSPVIKHTRLVYIQVSCDGFITTRNFEKKFDNANDDKNWALKKISEMDACPPNLLDFYSKDSEHFAVGLDQDFTWSALVFFYIMNRANKFAGLKFSATMISAPAGAPAKNPFTIIASTNGQFFGLYNINQGPPAAPAPPYVYKFNLHLEAQALPGDSPKLIPWLIDPVIKNQGPP